MFLTRVANSSARGSQARINRARASWDTSKTQLKPLASPHHTEFLGMTTLQKLYDCWYWIWYIKESRLFGSSCIFSWIWKWIPAIIITFYFLFLWFLGKNVWIERLSSRKCSSSQAHTLKLCQKNGSLEPSSSLRLEFTTLIDNDMKIVILLFWIWFFSKIHFSLFLKKIFISKIKKVK